jgi:hypothetical protein
MKRQPNILCVEYDLAVGEGRCAILKSSGYNAVSTSPQVAEVVLRGRKFDLIVVSTLSNYDQDRIVNLSDGADVLVLDESTIPSELLLLVAERLNRNQPTA